MAINRIHHGPFSRIGDRYATFIDPDHFLGRDASSETWIAPTNTSKRRDTYYLEVLLAGFEKDEIAISVEDDMLAVRATKKNPSNREYLSKEIPTDHAERKFRLPRNVDRDRIKANLENGILKIRLIDRTDGSLPKKIKIQ